MPSAVAGGADAGACYQPDNSCSAITGSVASGDVAGKRCLVSINDSAVVPMDDFLIKEMMLDRRNENHYDLLRVEREVLNPFTQGLPFSYRRLNWKTNGLEPIPGMIDSTLVILEGICAYHPSIQPYVDLRVWVATPPGVATKRGRERDADNENIDYWGIWRNCDVAYCAEFDPSRRADVIVSGV